jgi:hypothetical protein
MASLEGWGSAIELHPRGTGGRAQNGVNQLLCGGHPGSA